MKKVLWSVLASVAGSFAVVGTAYWIWQVFTHLPLWVIPGLSGILLVVAVGAIIMAENAA